MTFEVFVMIAGELGTKVIVGLLVKVATFREAPPAGPPVHTTLREIVLPSAEKLYVTVIVLVNFIFPNRSGVGAGMGLAACVGSPAAALNVTEGSPVFR